MKQRKLSFYFLIVDNLLVNGKKRAISIKKNSKNTLKKKLSKVKK